MNIKFFFLAALVSLAAANDPTEEHLNFKKEHEKECLRAELGDLIPQLTKDTFLPKTPEDFDQVKKRFEKAVQQCLDVARNEALTFKTKIYPFHLWPAKIVKFLMGGLAVNETETEESTGRSKRATYTYNYVDYRTKNMVTPVKDQKTCGSCYAFAGNAIVESQYLKKGLGSQDFSEQQIVDCSYLKYKGFQKGCEGGNPVFVAQYFNETTVLKESEYGYTNKRAPQCAKQLTRSTRSVDRQFIKVQDENHLAYILEKNGPVAILIDAGGNFQSYSSGVYNDPLSCKNGVNHAVTLVGLVKTNGQETWIIKNSWGPRWGENGYIRFLKGRNMCNMISTQVTVASLDKAIVY